MSKIYILLPVHNRKEITRGFVECLKAQTVSDYHLVLIDDGSTDGTAEMVRSYIPLVTILQGTGNLWWAGSLQYGLEWLKKHEVDKNALVLFINDDLRFSPYYLERAISLMTDKMGVLILSRYKSSDSDEIKESGVSADLKKLTFKEANSVEQINCLSTRGLFMHWSDIQTIGDFHPRLLPHYLSDYEYTIRAYRKGLKCETSAELTIEENNKTTGYHVINEIYFKDFVKKYFSKKSPGNPIYFSFFVFLTCKPIGIILNLAKIWAKVIKDIGCALITASKLC